MKLQLVKDVTSQRVGIFIQDSSSAVGAGLTGLLFNSAGLSWYYWREDEGNANATSVTLATATRGTFASGGFIEKDATNLPGFYEIGIPDAALATSADWVVMQLKGATNMAQLTLEIQLTSVDLNDGVRAGMTALPNGVAGTDTGLPIGKDGYNALADTTVLIATDDSNFTLTAGADDNNAYLNGVAVAQDHVSGDKSFRDITSYTGVSRAVVVESDFTVSLSNGNTKIRVYPSAGAATAAEIADAVHDEARADHVIAGSFGEGVLVEDLNTAAKASVNTEVDSALDTAIPGSPTPNSVNERIKAIDDKLPSGTIADAASILTTALTESYAANGADPTLTQAIFAIHQMLMQFGMSGTSLTVRKLDDAATAFVVTLDDATNPTDAKRV